MLATADAVPSVLGDLRTGSKPKRDLERLELRAQAAAIRGMVEKLSNPAAVAYLVALYLPKPQVLKQAGGKAPEYIDAFLEERKRHIYALAWWLLGQQGTGQHRIRGYQEIVSQYMLGGKSLDRVRALLKMDMNKVSEKRKECEELLKDLDKLAHALIDERLVTSRIIEDEYA